MTEKHVFHTKNIAATAAGRINRGINLYSFCLFSYSNIYLFLLIFTV